MMDVDWLEAALVDLFISAKSGDQDEAVLMLDSELQLQVAGEKRVRGEGRKDERVRVGSYFICFFPCGLGCVCGMGDQYH